MKREDILQQAMQVITRERKDQYGNLETNLSLIANLWSDYIGYQFKPDDVAMMMVLLKVARNKTGTNHADNYVDIAGYAAIAAEASGIVWVKGSKTPMSASTLIKETKEFVDKSFQIPNSTDSDDEDEEWDVPGEEQKPNNQIKNFEF